MQVLHYLARTFGYQPARKPKSYKDFYLAPEVHPRVCLVGDMPQPHRPVYKQVSGKEFKLKKHKAKKHAKKHVKKNKGFSLIELLIVVAIILIIAAIAIPNLLRSRIAANEASAVGSVRTLNTAEVTYNTTYPSVGFASLASLGPVTGGSPTSAAAGLIDANLASGTKSGYTFTVTPGSGTPVASYESAAAPVTQGTTGQRYFCSDSSGVIQYNASAATGATCASGSNNPI